MINNKAKYYLLFVMLMLILLTAITSNAHDGKHETHLTNDPSNVLGCQGTIEIIEEGWVCHVTQSEFTYSTITSVDEDGWTKIGDFDEKIKNTVTGKESITTYIIVFIIIGLIGGFIYYKYKIKK